MLELLHKEISSTELEGDVVAVAFTEEEEEAMDVGGTLNSLMLLKAQDNTK